MTCRRQRPLQTPHSRISLKTRSEWTRRLLQVARSIARRSEPLGTATRRSTRKRRRKETRSLFAACQRTMTSAALFTVRSRTYATVIVVFPNARARMIPVRESASTTLGADDDQRNELADESTPGAGQFEIIARIRAVSPTASVMVAGLTTSPPTVHTTGGTSGGGTLTTSRALPHARARTAAPAARRIRRDIGLQTRLAYCDVTSL